jgi:DNA-binding transcriptional ArsR family regulator
MSQTPLDEQTLELVAYRFKLLSDPMRLKILNILQNGELSVTDIVAEAGTSQPNVSKHLSSFKKCWIG